MKESVPYKVALASGNDSEAESKTPQPQYSYEEMGNHVKAFQEMGLAVIPIKYRSKQPVVDWKPYQSRKPLSTELDRWDRNHWKKGANIAIVCGKSSGGMIALDFDDPVKFHIVRAYGIVNLGKDILESTPVVRSSKGYHIWIKVKDTTIDRSKLKQIDIQDEGHIVVAPPSIHENGVQYQFINPAIKDILTINSLSDLGIETTMLAWATIDTPQWIKDIIDGANEGARNGTCVKLAVYFNSINLPKAVTLTILNEWASRCSPEYDIQEVARCVNWAYKSKEGPVATATTAVDELVVRSLDDIRANAPDLISLWADMLFPSSIVLLSGISGVGKTTFLYNMFMNLSNGAEFGGSKPIKPLNTLYLDMESSDSLIKVRANRISQDKHPNFNVTVTHNIMSCIPQVIKAIQRNGIDVLVIDTISMVFQTVSEDDNSEAARQMSKMREITNSTGVCIILVHHHGKNPANEGVYKSRGASARSASVDMTIDLLGDRDTAILRVTKNREGLGLPSITFNKVNGRFEKQSGLATLMNTSITKGAQVQEDIEHFVAGRGSSSRKDIHIAMSKLGYKEKTIDRGISDLTIRGRLINSSRGEYKLQVAATGLPTQSNVRENDLFGQSSHILGDDRNDQMAGGDFGQSGQAPIYDQNDQSDTPLSNASIGDGMNPIAQLVDQMDGLDLDDFGQAPDSQSQRIDPYLDDEDGIIAMARLREKLKRLKDQSLQ